MKIYNFLRAEHIFLDVPLPDKDDALRFLADTGYRTGMVRNKKGLLDALLRRERIMSTGVGGGIALPHASTADAADAVALLVRLARPIEFGAIDSQPVDILLALVLPEGRNHLHLQLLASLSRLCKNPEFLALLRLSRDSRNLWHGLKSLEAQMPYH